MRSTKTAQTDLNLHWTHITEGMFSQVTANPISILYKSIAGRYRPVSYSDGPITARYRFIKNAYWEYGYYFFSDGIDSSVFIHK